MRKEKGIVMCNSIGLTSMRRLDWTALVNLRVAMLSEIGLHAKTIARLIEEEFGEQITVGQIHTRNKARGRRLRDARDGDTTYMKMQIRSIQSWPAQRIKRVAPIPQLQLEGSAS
jgi:hypothetical protein